MRLLKAFAILASALFLFGCDDGDENGSDLPEPTGSGYLTGPSTQIPDRLPFSQASDRQEIFYQRKK